MSQSRLLKIVPVGLLGLALSVTPLAAADEKKTDEKKTAATKPGETKPAPASAPAKPAPGMVVVKDSVTGELRAPTAEEFTALQNAAPPPLINALSGPRSFVGPNGSRGMVLDDSTTVYATATRTADGRIAVGEVTGATAAKSAGSQTTVKPAPKVVLDEK